MAEKSNNPVILIAGTCVPAIVAESLYKKLANDLSQRSTVESLPSLGFGHANHSLDILEERHFSARTERVSLVGHSQGGLIALALAKRHPELVSKVFTLGAPFHGTNLASTRLPLAGVRCMTRDSRWLQDLVCDLGVEVHNFLSPEDRMVVPFTSCLLPGATNYFVSTKQPHLPNVKWIKSRTSHITLPLNYLVSNKIREVLCRAD